MVKKLCFLLDGVPGPWATMRVAGVKGAVYQSPKRGLKGSAIPLRNGKGVARGGCLMEVSHGQKPCRNRRASNAPNGRVSLKYSSISDRHR